MLEVIKPGIYDITSEQYHADPCPEPSLSASIANIIVNKTPKHAWIASRRLNQNYTDQSSYSFDFGKAVHSILLEPGKGLIEVVDAEDWRSKSARDKKETLQAEGKIPVISKQYMQIISMVDIAKEFISSTKIGIDFFDGMKETTLIAYDGCWLRGRLDCISQDRKIIFDYKTVINANPDEFINYTVFKYGYDIQAAMYLELNKLIGFKEKASYFWIIQEKEEPYFCSLIEASESVIACGKRKLQMAKQKWIECLRTNKWPDYGTEPFYLDAPSWEMANLEMLSV